MSERTEACKQCNNFDWYYYGRFSYCRFCHKEAQKRYVAGLSSKTNRQAPKRDLEYLVSPSGRKGSSERNKLACPQGHPYNKENTRTDPQKNGKSVNRLCRICDRNRHRVIYGLEPEPSFTKLSDLLDT